MKRTLKLLPFFLFLFLRFPIHFLPSYASSSCPFLPSLPHYFSSFTAFFPPLYLLSHSIFLPFCSFSIASLPLPPYSLLLLRCLLSCTFSSICSFSIFIPPDPPPSTAKHSGGGTGGGAGVGGGSEGRGSARHGGGLQDGHQHTPAGGLPRLLPEALRHQSRDLHVYQARVPEVVMTRPCFTCLCIYRFIYLSFFLSFVLLV